jgi:hypothetical protein
MDKSYEVIENYLSMLCGEDNIIYHHATVDSVTEVIKVATVTAVGKKYHLLYTVGTDVIIAKTYPSLNTITRILREIQPN